MLVLFWYPFHTFSVVVSSLFFLILSFGSPLFPIILIKSIACVSLFSLFLFPFSLPFSQTFSFSQHWNTGGSHPEELERPGAHPRLKTRPQPPLFHPAISAEPQFTDCVALSEHSILGGQIALQMNEKLVTRQPKCQSMSHHRAPTWTEGCVKARSAERDFMPYSLPLVVLNCEYLPNYFTQRTRLFKFCSFSAVTCSHGARCLHWVAGLLSLVPISHFLM